MATILPFIQRGSERARQAPPGGTAAIVFFTGVRYERRPAGEPDAPAEPQAHKARRPRRRGTQK